MAVVRFSRPRKTGPKVKRGPVASVLEFPQTPPWQGGSIEARYARLLAVDHREGKHELMLAEKFAFAQRLVAAGYSEESFQALIDRKRRVCLDMLGVIATLSGPESGSGR